MRIDDTASADAAVQELRSRFTFRVKPALALLTPEGDVVHVQYARLYPAYHFNGVEMSSWTERLWTSREILAMVERAEVQDRRERNRLAALAGKDDAAAGLEHASILLRRARPARAEAILDALVARSEGPEAGELRAGLLSGRERRAEARAAYRALLERFPAHARAAHWRFTVARSVALEVERTGRREGAPHDPELAAALEALHALADDGSRPMLQLRSRVALARHASATEATESLERHMDWITARLRLDDICDDTWSPALLMEIVDVGMLAGAAYQTPSRGITEAVLRCWPDSIEAQQIKHGRLDGNVCMVPSATR